MTKFELLGNAKFVEASEKCVAPSFRGTFNANNAKSAKITICGLGFFELYINGRRVSDEVLVPVDSHYHRYDESMCHEESENMKLYGEELGYRIYCVRYDITDYLVNGKNAIAVNVGPGWYFRYGECKLAYLMNIDGKELLSDETLKWRSGPVTEYNLTKGELQDYTKYDYNDGWMLPEYNDEHWSDVKVVSDPESEYCLQDCPADKVIRTLHPALIAEKGDIRVYDIGENLTGWPVVRCAKRAKKITLKVGEMFDAENVELCENWWHGQKCEYICDGSDREYRPMFTWLAGRYIVLDKDAELVAYEDVHADITVSSFFNSDNEILNWLYDAYRRTQLCNMHAGIPSDCPQIERRGYTGDGELMCEAVMMTLDCKEFYRKWMRDISDCQDRISGHVQYTAPYVRSGGGPGGWGCAIVEVPYIYYRMYGDILPAKEYFPQMLKYLDYLEAHSENDLVVSDQPNEWCLGEWNVPGSDVGIKPEVPDPFVNNYFYIKSINRMLEIAKLVGFEDKIPSLLEVRQRKIDAVMKNYFDESTGDFANNVNSANSFAIDIGLGDERTIRNLADHINSMTGVDVGIFGTDYVPGVLFRHGYAKEAFRFMTYTECPSFAYMKDSGATTLWEDWHGPRSMCHPMFGTPVKYLFSYLLGIRQTDDSCGYKKVIVAPAFIDGLNKVSGGINTESGRISVDIDKHAGKITIVIDGTMDATYVCDGKEQKLSKGENIFTL